MYLTSGSYAAPTRPNENRRHPRILFTVPIQIHHLVPGGIKTSHGISLDLSQCGLGALIEGRLTVGEAVEIDFPLRGSPLTTVAIVRHSSATQSGFEFLGLTEEECQQIARVIGGS